jgi:hypothetical protein
MERRQIEIRHIGITVDFLCDEYPELFAKGEYTHPVLGVCKTLSIKTLRIPPIDYNRINAIKLDFINNWVVVNLNTPDTVHIVLSLFKDGTVF